MVDLLAFLLLRQVVKCFELKCRDLVLFEVKPWRAIQEIVKPWPCLLLLFHQMGY